ncbi:MAG: hypothetical protein HC817_07690 [Saprospiraceae bacterium]|nr:hypothetical protein [Saprospiraceae bacterium]
MGFSQGGWASAGVQKALEQNNTTGLTLKGTACVAGAYFLKEISLKYAIANKSTLYLGYVANAYSTVYGQDISTILKPDYVKLIPTLFDGNKDVDFVVDALPKDPSDLYKPEMIDAINHNKNNWFTMALGQNGAYNWKLISKARLFYGAKDTDVSPEDAIKTYNYVKNLGGNVELVNLGDFDHTETFLNALPEIQKWFNNSK